MELPVPEALVLIPADQVYRDDVSGKFHINGTRSYLAVGTISKTHPSLTIYAVLTDGRDDVTLRFRLVDVDEDREAVAEEEVTVNFPNPLVEVDVVLHWADLFFPEAGDYRLQLFAGEHFLRERRVTVVMLDRLDN